jgi:chromosome segregation ATPase
MNPTIKEALRYKTHLYHHSEGTVKLLRIINVLQEAYNNREEQLFAYENAKEMVLAENNKLNTKIAELQNNLTCVQETNTAMNNRISQLETKRNDDKQRISALAAERLSLMKENTQLKAQREDALNKLKVVADKLNKAEIKLDELQTKQPEAPAQTNQHITNQPIKYNYGTPGQPVQVYIVPVDQYKANLQNIVAAITQAKILRSELKSSEGINTGLIIDRLDIMLTKLSAIVVNNI